MIKNSLLLVIILIFSQLLGACNSKKVYSQFKDFSNLKWDKKDVRTFEANLNLTTDAVLKLGIALRHTSHIILEKLPMQLLVESPSGQKTMLTIEFPIRNPENRQLLGEAMGDICDTKCWTNYQFKKQESGLYKFTIQHTYSRKDEIIDVISLGILVEKQ